MAMGSFHRRCCDCFEVIFIVTTLLFLPGPGNLLALSDFWYHIFHSTYSRFHLLGTLVASLSFLLNSLRLFHVLPVYTNNHQFPRSSKKRIAVVGQQSGSTRSRLLDRTKNWLRSSFGSQHHPLHLSVISHNASASKICFEGAS